MNFNDWELVKLQDIIEFNPKEFIKKNTVAKKISMKKLKEFNKIISGFELEEFKSGVKFRNGDILFARITPCLENGKTAQVTILNKDEIGFGSTEFIVMREKEGLSINDFIYYKSISNDFRSIAIKSMTGTSGRQRVQLDVLKDSTIYLPSVKEQQAIAKVLSDLDKKIQVNNNINKKLEEIAQNIFKHWFVDFEFPNQEGKPYKSSGGEMFYSELGFIPKKFNINKLADVLDTIESGNRPKGGTNNITEGIPSIGAENIIGLGQYNYSKEKYVPKEYFNNMKKGIIKSKDVLLYKDGAQLGRKTIFMDNFPYKECCINSHVFILRSNDLLSQEYLYLWLDQEYMTENIKNLNTNSAQPGINQTQLKKLTILVPNIDIISKFSDVINPLFKQIYSLSKENKKLSDIRDALLPKLMSGEIKVPIDDK
ncbi:MAG: restriction endonuclease subunit S [Peptostreptococcaceae bacterium]